MKFIIRLLVNAIGLYAAVYLLGGTYIFPESTSWISFLWLALDFWPGERHHPTAAHGSQLPDHHSHPWVGNVADQYRNVLAGWCDRHPVWGRLHRQRLHWSLPGGTGGQRSQFCLELILPREQISAF